MARLTARFFSILILFLSACSEDKRPRDTLPSADTEKILRIGNTAEPKTLDPGLSTLVAEAVIIQSLFQGLTDMRPDGQIIPGQAESWVISDDGLIYTFRLRDGLTWSDGVPMTADDFVYSLRRVLNPSVGAEFAPFYYPIENAEAVHKGELPPGSLGVVALDERVIEIALAKPKPSLIELLSHTSSYPVPKHVVEKMRGGNWARPETIVSNGPYILRDWQPGHIIKVERNPLFYESGNVAIDRIEFLPLEEGTEALDQFIAGTIDVVLAIPQDRMDWIQENLPETLHIEPQYGTYYYVFNTARPPFDDAGVRRALSLAIDPAVLVDTVLKDAGFLPAHSLVPPLLPSYEAPPEPPWRIMSPEERLQRARTLLQEAGFGPGHPLKFTLDVNLGTDHRALAEAVVAIWREIDVEAAITVRSFVEHDNRMIAGDFDMARTGWLSTFDSPEYFLNLLRSAAVPLNAGRYSNPEFDRLMSEALTEPRAADRAALMRHAEALALSEVPIIPIYHYVSRELVSPRVINWIGNPSGRHMVRFLDLEPARQ